MPDYKTMYEALFHKVTKAVHLLQEAQQEAEAAYLDSGGVPVRLRMDESNDGGVGSPVPPSP